MTEYEKNFPAMQEAFTAINNKLDDINKSGIVSPDIMLNLIRHSFLLHICIDPSTENKYMELLTEYKDTLHRIKFEGIQTNTYYPYRKAWKGFTLTLFDNETINKYNAEFYNDCSLCEQIILFKELKNENI